MPRPLRPLAERFWEKVDKSRGPAGCWLWMGATANYGYGVIGRGRRDEGVARAHVLAYEWTFGSVPDGMVVCHRCDTPPCVNPVHLFAAPQTENITDMRRKGRGALPPHLAGEDNPAARLDAFDVALVRTLLDEGMSHRGIAREVGVSKSTITRIAQNATWGAMPTEAPAWP